MTRPPPSIPPDLEAYDTTPEITGRIVAYRRGEVSFEQLLDDLSRHDYKSPSRFDMHPTSLDEWEGFDFHEPGTTGELDQARAINLLSDDEYESIVSGALRAHRA